MRLDGNIGWVAGQSGSDPVGSTDITQTRKASRKMIQKLWGDIDSLDDFTRQSFIDSILKAYPNKNGTTEPNGQRFSR